MVYVICYGAERLPRASSASLVIFVGGRHEAKLYRDVDFGRREKPDDTGGEAIQLAIQDDSGKIQVIKTMRLADGKDVTSKFDCEANGSNCVYEDGDHKAQVSLWYNGPALVVLKTDGPDDDKVSQSELVLSPDQGTLEIDVTHIAPESKAETMVFTKKK